jgi:hypothetical protein
LRFGRTRIVCLHVRTLEGPEGFSFAADLFPAGASPLA